MSGAGYLELFNGSASKVPGFWYYNINNVSTIVKGV